MRSVPVLRAGRIVRVIDINGLKIRKLKGRCRAFFGIPKVAAVRRDMEEVERRREDVSVMSSARAARTYDEGEHATLPLEPDICIQ